MGSILNSIVPKAGGSGMGGAGDRWHGPSYYQQNPDKSPPRNPNPQGFNRFDASGGLVDRGTQNTMNQFGQRLDKEGFNPFTTMSGTQGQGNAFNPLASLFGGQQGGQQGFNPLAGLFGGGQQQQGGQNPFSFLGGL